MVSRDAFNLLIAVYMMANHRNGTLYIGVTSQLPTRVQQHRDGAMPGFTRTYGLKRLVWYESHEGMVDAIRREKALKRYPRDWKINLIERENPNWEDLYPALIGDLGAHGWPAQGHGCPVHVEARLSCSCLGSCDDGGGGLSS